MIRSATPTDATTIAQVHVASFPGFFLTCLGPRFLSLLYRQMMRPEVGVVLVCEEERKIVGFVGGVTQQAGFYRQLVRRNQLSFALASTVAAIRQPSIIPRLLRALRRSREASQSAAEACLMSIGVSPSIQGKGTGRALVNAFCEDLRSRGIGSVCLTTDRLNNDRVNRFYQSLGFTLARVYTTPEGREMNEYVKTLT